MTYALTYETAKTTAARLEEINYHTEAALVFAEYCQQGHNPDSVFAAYITILKSIECCHELQGYITKDQQAMRDLIAKEVNHSASIKKNCGWDK